MFYTLLLYSMDREGERNVIKKDLKEIWLCEKAD